MYFFDSYALIELIKNKPSFDRFRDVVIVTGALNIAETHFVFLSLLPESKVNEVIRSLNVVLIEPDKETAIAASLFRFHNKKLKMSYADCLGYCTALAHNLKFVTGDDAFRNFESVEFVK